MLGLHLSSTNPIDLIVDQAVQWGCETFQVFLRNNRNLSQRWFTQEEISAFNTKLLRHHIDTWVVHAPYSMNPSSPYDYTRNNAIQIIKEDIEFLREFAGLKYYVLHPGSHKGVGIVSGMDLLYDSIQQIGNTYGVTICLEFMAGAGTEMLSSQEEILAFAAKAKDLNVKFTFDSCHAFAAGFMPASTYEVLKDYIGVVHINGSFGTLGSNLDRHSNLREGSLPYKFNERLYLSVPDSIPVILETPIKGALQDLCDLKNSKARNSFKVSQHI